jgi:arginase
MGKPGGWTGRCTKRYAPLTIPMRKSQRSPVMIIGVPLDLGSGRRGVDMGPSAIRYANLNHVLEEMGLKVEDAGNLRVPIPESTRLKDAKAKYEKEIFQVCADLSRIVTRAAEKGYIPIVLGGDHSIAMGSIVGSAKVHKPLGLLWFDAHGDFNTPTTSPTGNVHGMPLASVMGYGSKRFVDFCRSANIAPKNCALIGIRDVDKEEKRLLNASGVQTYTMEAVDRLGLGAVMERALAAVTEGTKGFHLSFDVDVMDPSAAPGVGTPALGGISYRESLMALEIAAETQLMRSMYVVEVNPIMDVRNQTALCAVHLIASALGKRII